MKLFLQSVREILRLLEKRREFKKPITVATMVRVFGYQPSTILFLNLNEDFAKALTKEDAIETSKRLLLN